MNRSEAPIHPREPFSAARINAGEAFWLAPEIVNKLRYLRGPGESYSDVILRLAVRETH